MSATRRFKRLAYNPWSKRPPTLPQETRTFELKSGESLTLTLRKLGNLQNTRVYELGEELKAKYVTGDAQFVESGGEDGDGPVPFPALGGETIVPTETMCSSAAFVACMIVDDEPVDADAWIGFQAVEDPADWIAIQKFATEVNRIGKPKNPKAADVPLASRRGTKVSSAPS